MMVASAIGKQTAESCAPDASAQPQLSGAHHQPAELLRGAWHQFLTDSAEV